MSIKLKGGGAVNLRAVTRADRPNASVSYEFVNEIVSGSFSEVVTVGDAIYNRNTSATYYYSGSVSVLGMTNPMVINLDPSRATIGTDGLVTRLASDTCRIIVRGDGISLPLTLDLATKSEDAAADEYVAPAVGSLAATLISQVQTRITNGMTMAANGKIFTSDNHTTSTYVRNPDVWCSDVVSKLTCISPWNSRGGVRRAGTLITPRHAVFVVHSHYYPYVGDVFRFVGVDNTVYERTVVAAVPSSTVDLAVCTFDSDLPSAITPCKVMPTDWNEYLVNNFQNRPPALGLDQEEKALCIDFNSHGNFLYPVNADRLVFSEIIIVGDSGNPAFLIVDGHLVLVTVWTSGGAGFGVPIAKYISEVNEMIVAADVQAGVSTGYTVTPADFSAYPNFTTQNYLIGDDGAGNKSLWVEFIVIDGKQSYILQGANHMQIYWDSTPGNARWVIVDDSQTEVDAAPEDVATPDLATFGIYTFTTP